MRPSLHAPAFIALLAFAFAASAALAQNAYPTHPVKLIVPQAPGSGADVSDPAIKAKLVERHLMPIPGTPAGVEKRGEDEAKVWGDLIRDLKLQAD